MIQTLQQAVRQSLDEQVANTPALLLFGNTAQIMKPIALLSQIRPKLITPYIQKSDDGVFQKLNH